MKITGLISAKLQDEKTQSLILIWMVFLFPAIALLNFFTGIHNSLLSYLYRLGNLLMAFIFITSSLKVLLVQFLSGKLNLHTFFGKKENLAFILLMAFWIFYLFRIYTDVALFGIYVSGKPSLNYYLLFTIGVTLMPSLAAPTFQIRDFSFFSLWLYRFLQAICLIFFIMYFVIVFSADYPVFRYILAWNEFEYLDAISISVTGALLILISLFQKSNHSIKALWMTIGAFLMAAAASRGPYLSLIIALSFIFIKKREPLKIIVLTSLSVVAGFLLHLLFTETFKEIFVFGNPIIERWLNYENDQSNINRMLLLNEGFQQIKTQVITGSHFVVVSLGMYVHNLVLDILLSTGIIGVLLLVPSVFFFIKSIFSDHLPVLIIGLTIFYSINSFFSGAVYNLNEFWFLFIYVAFAKFKLVSQ